MKDFILPLLEEEAFNTHNKITNIKEIAKFIGHYYRDEREERELTQEQIAEMASVPVEAIKQMENGEGNLACALYYAMLNRLDYLEYKDIYKMIDEKNCNEILDNPYAIVSFILDIDLVAIYYKAIYQTKNTMEK